MRIDLEERFGFIATSDGHKLYFSRENVVHPASSSGSAGPLCHSSKGRAITDARRSA
jgi:hypothetical protein